MNYRFKNFVNSACENKAAFDSTIGEVRSSLDSLMSPAANPAVPSASKTGWLRGSLSYPWVIVCSLGPSLKDLF